MSTTNGFVGCPHCTHKAQINMLFVDHNMAGPDKDYRMYCPKCKQIIFFNMTDIVKEGEIILEDISSLKTFTGRLKSESSVCTSCGDPITHVAELQKETCFSCQKCVFCGNQLTDEEIQSGKGECACCGTFGDITADLPEDDKELLKEVDDFIAENSEPEVDTEAPMWKQALQKYGME